MKRATLTLILILCCAFPALAKDKDKKEEPPPTITEVQRLTLENLQLKAIPLQQQIQALQEQYNKVVLEIEAEHPGWLFNSRNGTLVKKPEPSTPPTPEKK